MKIYRYVSCVIVVGSLGVAHAWAQGEGSPPRGAGRSINLAELTMQQAVQEELKLSTDEIDRLKQLASQEGESSRGAGRDREAARDRRKRMQEKAAEDEKKVAEILTPEQFQRLKQINWQVLGPRAFKNTHVVSTLALSGEQTVSIDTILRGNEDEVSRLFQEGGLKQANTEENKAFNRAQMAKIQTATVEKIVALLTPEQQAKWKDLSGEPFKGDVTWSYRGGRRRNRD